jgi:membrane-associated phospholipid phosphatase
MRRLSGRNLTVPPPGRIDKGQLAVGVALMGVGAVTTALVAVQRSRDSVQQADDAWYDLVQRTRSPLRTEVSRALDVGFGTTIDWTARVFVTAVLVRRRRWRALAGWAGTITLGELCIGPVKAAIDRARPPRPMTTTSDTSYPSGHAIAAATTAPGIVLALIPAGPQRELALGAAIALAAATALSRTDLNAHWLSDCIGGFGLGTGFALVVPQVVGQLGR